MKMLISSLLTLLVVSGPALAFPSGAGSCAAGTGAIRGEPSLPTRHVAESKEVTSGVLADGGLIVQLNGETLDPELVAEFETESMQSVTLTSATGEVEFAGFLMRIESASGVRTTDALSTQDPLAAVAVNFCQVELGVGGVTHNSNERKTSTTAGLMMEDTVDDLVLDVTVVIRSDSQVSTFYHSAFKLSAVLPPQMPTSAPVVPPPVNPPTMAPVPQVQDTMAPVPAAPTSSAQREAVYILYQGAIALAFSAYALLL